ncbi:hypothetical protein BgiBS90_011896, partial [Biomphalaria glabrata]
TVHLVPSSSGTTTFQPSPSCPAELSALTCQVLGHTDLKHLTRSWTSSRDLFEGCTENT